MFTSALSVFMIAITMLITLRLFDIQFSSWPYGFLRTFMIGAAAIVFAKYGGALVFPGADQEKSDAMYGLEHARLNLELPLKSMWMNMGYWKVAKDFPTACSSLLHEVLVSANIPPLAQIRLLDLGFGCGDQTLELLQLATKSRYEGQYPLLNESRKERNPLIKNYIGITLSSRQYHYALTRLDNFEEGFSRAHLFQGDAADPGSWDHPDLKAQISTMKQTVSIEADNEAEPKNWVLALDTLYHFSPSRLPIFTHTHDDLNASLMAFDLLLSNETTVFQRLILCLLAKMMRCPMNTFMREWEYRILLREAGYRLDDIEMTDVSKHCFTPLADFLAHREGELRAFNWELGRFRAAKWMFGWWGRSGIVRGVIVIARR